MVRPAIELHLACECGHRWTAVFPSGVQKRVTFCPNCHCKEVPTSVSGQAEITKPKDFGKPTLRSLEN
jgi:hypothetical protein